MTVICQTSKLRIDIFKINRITWRLLFRVERVKKSLLRRMKWLDGTSAAKTFTRRMLAPTRLGNIAQLSTEFGADCLDRLVHVDPDAVIGIDKPFQIVGFNVTCI